MLPNSPANDSFLSALALHRAGRLDDAEALYRTLLFFEPGHMHALTLLGTIAAERGNYEEGIRLMSEAIAAHPNHAEAYFNRALAHQKLGCYEEALEGYAQAARIDPTYDEAFWHQSLILLTLGRYAEGWPLYEWRWKTRPDALRQFTQPRWAGEKGKRLFIYAEQGMGDTLQFCRYLSIIARDNAVTFECDRSLVPLLSYNFLNVKIIAAGAPLPECDYQIPLLSLPGVLGTRLETIPPAPYLRPEPNAVKRWAPELDAVLGSAEESLRIGLCWAGGQRPHLPHSMKVDARRSLVFDQLTPLLEINNASFLSLQLGSAREQRNNEKVKDVADKIKDWSDTASIVSLLHLIITVDTSVCHLAAAMGKPTFLLNRYDTCWRWLLNRNDSPWYPSLTQFRQETPGDWTGAIARVKAAVMAEMKNSPGFPRPKGE